MPPESPPKIFNVPFRQNPFFSGREYELARLHRALAKTEPTGLKQPQTISGLGGMGKTQLVVEYAYTYQAEYDYVFWVLANTKRELEAGFVEIGRALNLPEVNQSWHQPLLETGFGEIGHARNLRENEQNQHHPIVVAVQQWMVNHPKWLLILDNATDLAIVRPFLPNLGKGSILVTTQIQDTEDFAKAVELAKFDLKTGVRFLLERADLIEKGSPITTICNSELQAARTIYQEMDGLPLALDQVGAYITETRETLVGYVGLYQAEGKLLRQRRGNLDQSHQSVTITFSLALAKITHLAANDLLRLCAFLAPDAIPIAIFQQSNVDLGKYLSPIALDHYQLNAVIANAMRFSLIKREKEVLHIHRLVQEVIRDQMDEETQYQWAEHIVQALDQAFPSSEFQAWPFCASLTPHCVQSAKWIRKFNFHSTEVSRLLNKTGFYLYQIDQLHEAEPLLLQALEICEKHLAPDHPDIATKCNNLALLYSKQKRLPEAKQKYQKALSILKKYSGDKDTEINIARTLNNLGGIYLSLKQYSEAESKHKEALSIRKQILGPKDKEVANSLNNLADLYSLQERYTEAYPYLLEALKINMHQNGLTFSDIDTVFTDFTFLGCINAQELEGQRILKPFLELIDKKLTFLPEPLLIGCSFNNLGGFYYGQKQYVAAELFLNRAYHILNSALGEQHIDTKTVKTNWQFLLRKLAKNDQSD